MSALGTVHAVAFWAAVAAYAGLAAIAWTRPSRELEIRFLIAALVLELVAIVPRWIETTHPPIFGTYENGIAAALSVAVVLFVHLRGTSEAPPRYRALMSTWPAAFMLYGSFFSHLPYPLTISERSILVDIHVLFAWSAFAVLLSGSMRAASALLAGTAGEATEVGVMLRTTGQGFALFTAMIATGAVYSYVLFSDYYRWEIVGTSSVIAWLGYSLALHAYLLFGWRDRRLAWILVGMVPVLLFVFWSWSLFSGTYHSFDLNALIAR